MPTTTNLHPISPVTIKPPVGLRDDDDALRVLWSIGLSPAHHPDLLSAARGAKSIVEHLRRELADPPPDIQELVLRKLGICHGCKGWAFADVDIGAEPCRVCQPNNGVTGVTTAGRNVP